jgi:hypothetical protein
MGSGGGNSMRRPGGSIRASCREDGRGEPAAAARSCRAGAPPRQPPPSTSSAVPPAMYPVRSAPTIFPCAVPRRAPPGAGMAKGVRSGGAAGEATIFGSVAR